MYLKNVVSTHSPLVLTNIDTVTDKNKVMRMTLIRPTSPCSIR